MLRLIYPNGIILEATDQASQLILLNEQSQYQVYTVTELPMTSSGTAILLIAAVGPRTIGWASRR
jgi:lipid A disaccharide synthetase